MLFDLQIWVHLEIYILYLIIIYFCRKIIVGQQFSNRVIYCILGHRGSLTN